MLATFALLGGACDPAPRDVSSPIPSVAVGSQPPHVQASSAASSDASDSQTLSCKCDVLDFESDGPPGGHCTMALSSDGSATLRGVTSSPTFSAELRPRAVRDPSAVDYVFEGEFEFACKDAWCGRRQLQVLRVGDRDYRVTVARSPDGPPSHVLWIQCGSP